MLAKSGKWQVASHLHLLVLVKWGTVVCVHTIDTCTESDVRRRYYYYYTCKRVLQYIHTSHTYMYMYVLPGKIKSYCSTL